MHTFKERAIPKYEAPHVYDIEVVPVKDGARRVYHFTKRAADIVLSLVALIVLSPVFLLIAAAVKIDSRGSVFFRHERVGKNGSPLVIHKFRTMRMNADEMFNQFTPAQRAEFEKNYKLDNDPRVTRLGKFLRESSLDELPQLFDILIGHLSLVGPRPLVEKEIEKYGDSKHLLLSVKPGLTGNWQVNGRNSITYRERINLELYYASNATFWLDVKILFKTIPVVIRKIGAK